MAGSPMTAPAPVRTAPPYRLVLPASADRDTWLAERRKGMCSSDIPQALGVSEHGSPQHVYYDKRGMVPEQDENEAMRWGRLLEETVAREWARRNRAVVRRVGLIARKGTPHHMCTLDRLAAECPLNRGERERCALEVKCRNAYVAKKWKKNIPDDVLAQTLWEIIVGGFEHVHVACLIGGSDFRQYTVRRADHADLIGNIVTVVDRLWRDIALGHVPPLDGSEPVDAMLDLYSALYPDRAGVADLDEYPALSVAAIDNMLAHQMGLRAEKAGEREKEAAKVAMVEALGPHRVAILNGEPAYELREMQGREKCDFNKLREKYPEAYAECVGRKPYDQLFIAKEHKLKGDAA